MMTDEEIDARLEGPRDEWNDAELVYVEALEHLLSGRKPKCAALAERWRKGRLRPTVSTVADEADRERDPIGSAGKRYGWIWQLIQRHHAQPIAPVFEIGDIGTRGAAATIVQLRSLLAAEIALRAPLERKARLYDEFFDQQNYARRPRKARQD